MKEVEEIRTAFRSLQACQEFVNTIKNADQFKIVKLVSSILHPDDAVIGYMLLEKDK